MEGQKLGNLNPSFYPNQPNFANATIIIHNYNHELPERTNFGTSKIKVILSQCTAALAIFAANFVTSSFLFIFFSIGETIIPGFFPFVTESSTIFTIIGLLAGGIIAQIVGGRMTITVGGIVIAGSLLWSTLISSIATLKWITQIVSLTTGMMQGPYYVYLAEITQSNTRTSLMSITYLSPIIGQYFITYLTKVASLKTIIYITAIFPIFGSVLMFVLPDSPYWLANKGRYNGLESSLAWYRGWTVTSDVKSESTMIINNAQRNSSAFKLFGQKSLYVPIAIVCYVFIIKAFLGYSFVTTALPFKLGFHFLDDITNVFGICCRLLPAILFFLDLTFMSKRTCFLWSLFGTSLGLLITVTFMYSESSTNSWPLLFSLSATTFCFNAGVLQVPLLLNAELFPSRLRNVGAGLGLFFMYLIQYLAEKCYFESSWTINSITITLACVSIFGFISLIWLFPRNENKTLVEIEESSNSIRSLRKKK